MKENTSSPQDPKELESSDSSQADQQDNIQAKLEKCDTLLDLLEENGTSGVSSKETTSESTAYPEFGNSSPDAQKTTEFGSLQIRICTPEISQSAAQELTAGVILASDESVEQTVEILWQNQVIGRGHLYTRDNHYVIEIAELDDLNLQVYQDHQSQQDYAYEI